MANREELIEEVKNIMEALQWDLEFLAAQALDRLDNLPISVEDLNIEDAESIIRFAKDMNEDF